MIVETSALVALALQEPSTPRLMRAVDRCDSLAIGAPSLLETGLVLSNRRFSDARTWVDRFLDAGDVTVVSFGPAHWPVALDAFARYGKGRHPAALNFGDCLSYAIAKVADAPLLFVGDDFAQTDITPAA